MTATGTLYIVATPIGNLDDMTFRAISVLKEVEIIAAEDTRRTRKLLNYFDIHNTLHSYHDHNAERISVKLLDILMSGRSVALVTDGGTPCISDPGYRIVCKATSAAIPVVPVPGACACVAALSVSGLPTDRFVFEGFLPRSPSERQKRWKIIENEHRTIVLYEAPHRMKRLLHEMVRWIPHRDVVLCREMTKYHEEFVRGTPQSLAEQSEQLHFKGEFTILISGNKDTENIAPVNIDALIEKYITSGLKTRELAEKISQETGTPFRTVYRVLIKKKEET